MINTFSNKYKFLSNFYETKLIISGKEFNSVEHAYQAFKTIDPSEREWVRNAPTAKMAKAFGKKVKVRKDWDIIKYKVMMKLVRLKFKDEELKNMLIETNNEELKEGNYWHDNIWGDCWCNRCKNKKGKNWLGNILMIVRSEIGEAKNV